MTRKFGEGAILVTGGAGFIGSHVVEALHAEGHRVHVLDNLSTGCASNIPREVALHTGDIRSKAAVAAAIHEAQAEVIVHCAAQTSVERSMNDPDYDRDVNETGTQVLLDAARQASMRRFVFISSGGAIYGETSEPATEETPPSPGNFYGTHKLWAEKRVQAAELSFAILRPSNVYGPRQRSDAEGGVLAIFGERIADKLPVEIHGDGRQLRDFLYVSDLVDAVGLAVSYSEDVVWNVGSGVATPILDAAVILGELLGVAPQLIFRPRRAGDVDKSLVSAALITSTGRWGPPVPLRAGLRQLIERSVMSPAGEASARGRVQLQP
jgi:UDP-glucose 4-epimerase